MELMRIDLRAIQLLLRLQPGYEPIFLGGFGRLDRKQKNQLSAELFSERARASLRSRAASRLLVARRARL